MALVRLKRRLSDDPLQALVLTSKKQKKDDVRAIFTFAATVEKEDDVSTIIKKAFKEDGGPFKRTTVSDVTEKARANTRLSSQNNRLKVINCFRSIEQPSDSSEEGSKSSVAIVDMESCESGAAQKEKSKEEDGKYVYDLYYANLPDVDDLLIERMQSGVWTDQELVFEHYRPTVDDSSDGCDVDDDDDSNDENNWRNDYPDEDELEDEDDRRLAQRIAGFTLDDYGSDSECGRSLSSDCDDEDLVYGDADDIDRYGRSYAAYKLRNRSDEDDEEDYNSN